MEQAIRTLMFEVSNNSQITNITINTVLEKLNSKEKHEFLTWLKIIRDEKQRDKNTSRRFW